MFYKLPVSVKFVDDVQKLASMIQDLQQYPERVVAIDTEKKPNTAQGEHNPTALLQVATKDVVYVVDMKLPRTSLAELDRAVFASGRTVLGFDVASDIRSAEGFGDSARSCANLLDLQRFKNPQPSQRSKLTDMVGTYLGAPLDKQHQLSDWSQRPLEPSQLQYAALDAYCLLPLWDKLQADPSYQLDDLKVATKDVVYVVDMKLPRTSLAELDRAVFASGRTVLGFDVASDIRSAEGFGDSARSCANLLDLQRFTLDAYCLLPLWDKLQADPSYQLDDLKVVV